MAREVSNSGFEGLATVWSGNRLLRIAGGPAVRIRTVGAAGASRGRRAMSRLRDLINGIGGGCAGNRVRSRHVERSRHDCRILRYQVFMVVGPARSGF
jgi:hypothetical protein